jgi:hypothetical protein
VAGRALVSQRILAGDLRTGRIRTVIPVTGAQWTDVLNAAGAVDQVTVTDDVVRELQLRHGLPAARSFLAFEDDDRIRQAGPMWARTRSWENGTVTLGAGGLWSLFDYRKILPVLTAGMRVQGQTVTISNTDLGGIARGLVALAMQHTGGDLPVVLPAAAAGTHTESFPGWKLLTVSDQLRELTQRETEAPDIAFEPRRRADDERFIEWVMRVGTTAAPLLTQTGDDWVFDASAPRSAVRGITTDEDARVMGMRAWETGNGQEADILMEWREDRALTGLGWPLLEVDESRPTVEESDHPGHARRQSARRVRPPGRGVQGDRVPAGRRGGTPRRLLPAGHEERRLAR